MVTNVNWQLSNIIAKVRATTGRPDVTMMTDATIIQYINNYYQYVLPKELKIFFGYTYYSFYTSPNQQIYTPPTSTPITATFQNVIPDVWCDGFPMEWYLDPGIFYSDYPIQRNKIIVGTGSPSPNVYTFQTGYYPILPGSLYVSDGANLPDTPTIAQDDGAGGFINPTTGVVLSGTVDYLAGVVSGLIFNPAPSANTNITASLSTYMAARPQGLLFYNNEFVIKPVPDNVYKVTMQGIKIPTAFAVSTDVPFRMDLGPLIAYGASIEIFYDFNQNDQADQYKVQYLRYKDICMQDTYEEYIYERSTPRF